MASDAARGLFHGAIAQSGYGTWPLLRSRLAQTPGPANLLMDAPDAAEYDAEMIVQRTGQVGVDLKSLQAIPARQLVDAQTGFQLPIVDGSVVVEEPGIRFQAGAQHAIPYLAGGNSYEGTIMPSYQIDPEVYEQVWNLFDPHWPMAYQRDFQKSPNHPGLPTEPVLLRVLPSPSASLARTRQRHMQVDSEQQMLQSNFQKQQLH